MAMKTILDFLTDPSTGLLVEGFGLILIYLAYPDLRRRYRTWSRHRAWRQEPF
jgi:hypothetical protein